MALVDQIHALATKCAQMDKDLDTRLSNINVDTLEKPYTDYKPSLSDIDIAKLQDGAIVVTDDPISDSSNAVLAEVEQSLSSGKNTVPSSYAVKEAITEIEVDINNIVTELNDKANVSDLENISTILAEKTDGKLKLLGSRNSDGYWTITGVTPGKPLFIAAYDTIGSNISSTGHVTSGATNNAGYSSKTASGQWCFGNGLTSSNIAFVMPTDTTVVWWIKGHSTGLVLQAWQ